MINVILSKTPLYILAIMCEGSHFVQNAVHMAPRALKMVRPLATRGDFLHTYRPFPCHGQLQTTLLMLPLTLLMQVPFDAAAPGTPLGAPGPTKRPQ